MKQDTLPWALVGTTMRWKWRSKHLWRTGHGPSPCDKPGIAYIHHQHKQVSLLKTVGIFMLQSQRPRWLGRLSSCLQKSILRVQFSPSAHTRPDSHTKLICGKARGRELATFDGNGRAVGMLNPMRKLHAWHGPGGRRDDTCNHGLFRRPLRVQSLTS